MGTSQKFIHTSCRYFRPKSGGLTRMALSVYSFNFFTIIIFAKKINNDQRTKVLTSLFRWYSNITTAQTFVPAKTFWI